MEAEPSESSGKKWFPLESNPLVMNNYARGLGLTTSIYSFHDVLSVEEWAMEMVPKPVKAVVFLYPINAVQEAFREEEGKAIVASGQHVSPNVYFMKQTVGNACGTVGILHSVFNSMSSLDMANDCFLKRFYASTKDMTPEEKARALEGDTEIEECHGAAAEQGQSEQKDIDEDINTHFICLTHVDGHVYELDGRKQFPINHGPSSEVTLLSDACTVIKRFMERDPTEMRFTIVALCAFDGDDAEDG